MGNVSTELIKDLDVGCEKKETIQHDSAFWPKLKQEGKSGL